MINIRAISIRNSLWSGLKISNEYRKTVARIRNALNKSRIQKSDREWAGRVSSNLIFNSLLLFWGCGRRGWVSTLVIFQRCVFNGF